MRALRPLLFRIFYSTTFTIVFLLVIGFIVVTPADAIRQAWEDGRQGEVGAIAGTYVVTGLLAILIYSSRLYTDRSVLQGIPKPYVPIEKDDLPGKVARKEIAESLQRSALVAYRAKPRFQSRDDDSPTASARISTLIEPGPRDEESEPSWLHIAHPGWSSPASPDLPNLHYDKVIAELASLIEAKAVSLAPVDPLLTSTSDQDPLPDERVVDVLQRPLNMGMRDYTSHLDSLGLINPPSLAPDFLRIYERARFSTKPLDEPDFRDLMGIFASILRGMTKLDPDRIPSLQDADWVQDEVTDGRHPEQTDWLTPDSWSRKSASTFSVDQAGSIHHHHPPPRVSEDSVPSLPTDAEEDAQDDEVDNENEYAAPLSQPQRASRTRWSASHSQPQLQSGSQSLRPSSDRRRRLRHRNGAFTSHSVDPRPSHHSLRQTHSHASVTSRGSAALSQGSVIRLRDPSRMGDLPYTIAIPGISERRFTEH